MTMWPNLKNTRTLHDCVVFFQKYKEFERAVRVEEIDGLRLVKRLAENMENMFRKKALAMKVCVPIFIFILYTQNNSHSL